MASERITAVELDEIEALVRAMEAATRNGESDSFLRSNRAFHFSIYRGARSHHLMPIIESLWLKFGPLLRVPLGPGSRSETRTAVGGQHHHTKALAALRAGDGDAARHAIQSDLAETAAWFAEHYDRDSDHLRPSVANGKD